MAITTIERPAMRHHVLPSATYDIVVGPQGKGHPLVIVDPNYKAEGPNIHEVNSDGRYGQAMAAVLRDTLQGREGTNGLHNSYNRSYRLIQHGQVCVAIFDGIGSAVAGSLQVPFTSDYAFTGVALVKGALSYNNRSTTMWYYSDFEIAHSPGEITKDLKVLRNLMGGSFEDAQAFLGNHWIRWPTGNWQTPDASVPGLLTKSRFYGECLDHVRHADAPIHTVLDLEHANAQEMKKAISKFVEENADQLKPGSYIVVKPDVGCTRAMGVRTLYVGPDGKISQDAIDEVADFLFDPKRVYSRHAPPVQWLIELGVERDVIQFKSDGKLYDLYYDLVPMVVAGNVVSLGAKLRSVESGQPTELMPGQNPAEIAFLDVERPEDLEALHKKYADKYGISSEAFAIEEARGADALRSYLAGSDLRVRVTAAAEEVHQRSIEMLEGSLEELHGSLIGARR